MSQCPRTDLNKKSLPKPKTTTACTAAASGWAGWVLAHPEFGSSVNPITIRGADYAHHITASPPGFENPAASLPRKNLEKFYA